MSLIIWFLMLTCSASGLLAKGPLPFSVAFERSSDVIIARIESAQLWTEAVPPHLQRDEGATPLCSYRLSSVRIIKGVAAALPIAGIEEAIVSVSNSSGWEPSEGVTLNAGSPALFLLKREGRRFFGVALDETVMIVLREEALGVPCADSFEDLPLFAACVLLRTEVIKGKGYGRVNHFDRTSSSLVDLFGWHSYFRVAEIVIRTGSDAAQALCRWLAPFYEVSDRDKRRVLRILSADRKEDLLVAFGLSNDRDLISALSLEACRNDQQISVRARTLLQQQFPLQVQQRCVACSLLIAEFAGVR